MRQRARALGANIDLLPPPLGTGPRPGRSDRRGWHGTHSWRRRGAPPARARRVGSNAGGREPADHEIAPGLRREPGARARDERGEDDGVPARDRSEHREEET